MPPLQRYHWDTPEYADAFATLLRALGGRDETRDVLREILSHYPADSHAVDWGAGSGVLTAALLERFRHVYAVEPNPAMRATLAARCPRAQVIAGTLLSAAPPVPVRVGLISHVFYHVPDHEWGAHTIRAAGHLAPDGVLVVILGDADSGANRLLEHFGAPRFDLYAGLDGVLRRHKEFDFAFTRRRTSVRTTSLDDTLKVARFILCDRDESAYSRTPTEEEFRDYVRAELWDEGAGRGGWDHGELFCLVRPNRAYAR
jgi:hypothetical protein